MSYKDCDIELAVESAAKRLGYKLRERQREVVVSFVRGRDVFVCMPTGSGKSLCYSVLPWTFDHLKKHPDHPRLPLSQSIVIVVSPLIALMKDQVSALNDKGLSAVYVSGDTSECNEKIIEELHEGNFQVVFFSPESLLTDETWRDMVLSKLYKESVVGFVVDEAHCVKKW